MKKLTKKQLSYILVAVILLLVLAYRVFGPGELLLSTPEPTPTSSDSTPVTPDTTPDKDAYYYTKEDVALYIHTYGCLPDNFITKNEARDLGWTGGPVEPYAPGMAIGGDHFGNYENLLPKKQGRSYTECDIDTKGKARGDKRIVFSNDGLIYYTDDHYESFILLYGEE